VETFVSTIYTAVASTTMYAITYFIETFWLKILSVVIVVGVVVFFWRKGKQILRPRA